MSDISYIRISESVRYVFYTTILNTPKLPNCSNKMNYRAVDMGLISFFCFGYLYGGLSYFFSYGWVFGRIGFF